MKLKTKTPKPNQKAKGNKVRCDLIVTSGTTLVDFKISPGSFLLMSITNVGSRTKNGSGCLEAFGALRFVFLCDTRASSSPQSVLGAIQTDT